MDALIIENILGSLRNTDPGKRRQDHVTLQWYECAQKIIHTQSSKGRPVSFRRLKENEPLHHLDIIWQDDDSVIWVEIAPTRSIVLKPATMAAMARIAYEIGNKHIPLFMEGGELLLPWEQPIYEWLQDAGFNPQLADRILDNSLKNTLSTETGHYHHAQ